MTTEKATQIDVDVDSDDGSVMIWFHWDYANHATAVYTSRADGNASLGMKNAEARKLHRKLGEALGGYPAIPPEREQEIKYAVAQQLQDRADAGHPDEEELMAEAEVRGGA